MPEKTRKYLLAVLLLLFGIKLFPAPVKKLSEQAQISILIGACSGRDMFSLFGHAAMRIADPELAIDYVFNYGFPPSSTGLTNFLRLLQTNIPSELYAVPFSEIEKEYRNNSRALNELTLNFSQEEKESLWQSLMTIAQSGSRVSYYNILSHNCTALPLILLEKNTSGTLLFPNKETGESYRSFSNECLHAHPWASFLINISFGLATDRPVDYRESFFLPRNFEAELLSTNVADSLGNTHPLIAEARYLVPSAEIEPEAPVITPTLCGWILLTIVMLLSVVEWKTGHLMRWLDAALFAVFGIGGLYLFYIQFIVPQWYSFPSWWILWLHPLHFPGAVWSAAKRFDRPAAYYHIFNLCALSVMLIGICFVPQYFHPAFAPLIILSALRSIVRIIIKKNNHFKK
jgi:hypothetical protein